MEISDLTAWGYCLAWTQPGQVPEFCGCQCRGAIPDCDFIFYTTPASSPAKLAAKWELTEPEIQRLLQRHTEIDQAGRLAFFQFGQLIVANPCFTELADARSIKQDFFRTRDDVAVLGIGFLAPELMAFSDFRNRAPLAPEGEFLGFDLYGLTAAGNGDDSFFKQGECFLDCPFRHCDMENEIPAELGITLTPHGLYPDPESAARAAVYVNEGQRGEPGTYVPFAILKY